MSWAGVLTAAAILVLSLTMRTGHVGRVVATLGVVDAAVHRR